MEIAQDRRGLAIRAASALIESMLVEEDNYIQRLTRIAYIMILDTLQGCVAKEQLTKASRRAELHATDPGQRYATQR